MLSQRCMGHAAERKSSRPIKVEVTKNYKMNCMYYVSSFYHTRKWQRIKALAITAGVSFGIGAFAMLHVIAYAVGVFPL